MKTAEGKMVVLGSPGVGKTSLIRRYVEEVFHHYENPTVGASFFNCHVNLEGAKIKLQIWDTAGQERFRSMAPMYYRNASIAMLVFDLTQYSSFSAIQNWMMELQRNVTEPMVLVLIGNKSDLTQQRQLSYEEGQKYATKIGATYHETSALHNDGIEAAFLAISTGLLKLQSGNQDMDSSCNVRLESGSEITLSPSVEESQNTSIAHATYEKPFTCC